MLRARRPWLPCVSAVRNSPSCDFLSCWRPPQRSLDAGDQQTARRGVIGIRGDPERNTFSRTAILSAVMGGRPIDPTQAAADVSLATVRGPDGGLPKGR